MVTALQSENLTFSGGKVKDAGKDLLIRVTGEFNSLDEVRALALASGSGGTVRLGEIAEVRDYHADSTGYAIYNDRPSVSFSLQKQTNGNTVSVSGAVKQALQKLQKELPPGVVIKTVTDQADLIQRSINTVYEDIILGTLLAMIIIYLFLRNWRSTVIISVTIPIALVSTFILMYFRHMTLNMLTLGGLSLGIGRMVDDAIVVLDNIYRHREEGLSAGEAASFGASEVTNAVVASTLTTVSVFLPVGFTQGIAAEIFMPMAMTVFSALMASLVVALSVTPLLASRFFARPLPPPIESPRGFRQKFVAGKWFDRLSQLYTSFLAKALRRRKLVLLVTVIIFVASLGLAGSVGMEFFPSSDEGQVSISIKLAKGTVLEETGRISDRVINLVKKQPEVKDIYLQVGSSGGSFLSTSSETPEAASITVKLADLKDRKRSSNDVAAALRQGLKDIAGAEFTVSTATGMGGTGSGSPIQLNVMGDDLTVLAKIAADLKKQVETVPGAVTVKSSLEEGRPQVEVIVDRERAAYYNLGAGQIGNTVAAAVSGKVATRYRVGGDEYDLRVRLDEASRQSLADLENLTIPAPTGAQVPLKQVAKLQQSLTPSTIARTDQERTASVTADLQGRPLGDVMNDIRAKLDAYNLPPGYTIDFGGEDEDMRETFASLGMAFIMAILLVYMIMAAQFESLLYPFVIMFAIPLSLTGVVLGLLISGRHFGVTAFVGFIMLSGIVLSNAIVLVDFINTLRRRGVPRQEAIIQAGGVRLRPIIMTALVTVLAMLPIGLALGEGSEFMAPMATAVIGGLITSTVLTLVVVPVIYTTLEDIRDFVLRRRGKAVKEDAAKA